MEMDSQAVRVCAGEGQLLPELPKSRLICSRQWRKVTLHFMILYTSTPLITAHLLNLKATLLVKAQLKNTLKIKLLTSI